MHVRHYSAALAAMLAAGLAGCGGSSDGDAPPPPTTTEVKVLVRAVSAGPFVVCLDGNGNQACDAGEPSATTDAAGTATIEVDNADLGKWPVIALPASGGGLVPVVLRTPADQTARITPLTTLVQAQVEASGSSSAEAADYVRQRASLGISPLDDYQAADAASESARLLAEAVEAVMQGQTGALAPSLGSPDISGAAISGGDIANAVQVAVLGALPAISSVATEAANAGADRNAVLAAGVQQVVEASGLDAAGAAGLIGATRLAGQPSDAGIANDGGTVRMFVYAGPDDWSYRAILSTDADRVAGADGYSRYYEERAAMAGGTLQVWGYGGVPERGGDLHWNGSAWVDCPIGFRSRQRTIEAGFIEYDYCDGLEAGTTRIGSVDVAGNTLASVIARVRELPGLDSGVPLASFGPSDLGLLGSATMPAGAALSYRVNTPMSAREAYDPRPGTIARAFHPDVAAGGDARTDPAVPCSAKVSGALDNYSDPAATLEAMIAGALGQPCIYPTGADTLPMNEGWGTSTVGLGNLPGAATRPEGTGSFYSTTLGLRAAFTGPGNAVTYYGCLLRASDNVTRNCTPIGSGSYRIDQLGDARVLHFENKPAIVQSLGNQVIYVERGGNVHSGFVLNSPAASTVRLNLTAANALFSQLGLPAIVPH